jgi:hypothetical protein
MKAMESGARRRCLGGEGGEGDKRAPGVRFPFDFLVVFY